MGTAAMSGAGRTVASGWAFRRPFAKRDGKSEFLRTLLQRHRRQLVGRFSFGFRTIARILGNGDHRGFRLAPMQLVIAVSDGGTIRRLDGWKAPQKPFRVFLKKADLVAETIEHELERHRTGANPLHVKPVGKYGIWSMEAEEVPPGRGIPGGTPHGSIMRPVDAGRARGWRGETTSIRQGSEAVPPTPMSHGRQRTIAN